MLLKKVFGPILHIYLRAPINTTIDTIYSISRQFSFEKSDGPDDSTTYKQLMSNKIHGFISEVFMYIFNDVTPVPRPALRGPI